MDWVGLEEFLLQKGRRGKGDYVEMMMMEVDGKDKRRESGMAGKKKKKTSFSHGPAKEEA